jgi:glycosyltransferase involved in cell wall biosynthesis
MLEAVRRAVGVICPSEFSAAEVRELIGPQRVWVVPYAAHERFATGEALSAPALHALGVEPPFVVCAGGATARKNHAGLARAWRAVQSAFPRATLVLCGPQDARRDGLFGGLARVRCIGRVELSTLVGLVHAAQAVVVPSTYEGFGLPALEAMAAGVVVVAASRASLPEVCGDAAILVEPTAEDLAAGLAVALDDAPALAALRSRARERAALFSWERTAAAHLAAYREALLA